VLLNVGRGVTCVSPSCYGEPLEYIHNVRNAWQIGYVHHSSFGERKPSKTSLDPSGGTLGIALDNSIQEWRRFTKHSAPGRRFRDRYRRQQACRNRSMFKRACNVSIGVAIAIGSTLLAPLPGPGLGTFVLGLGIVAGEVPHVARLLDRTEVRLREMLQRTRHT
jgi:hypothetical protein